MFLRHGSQHTGNKVRLCLARILSAVLLLACCACQNAQALKPEVLLTGLAKPGALVFDNYCRLYIAESGNGRVLALHPGSSELIVVSDGFHGLTDLAIDRENTLYVASKGAEGQSCVYSITPSGYRNLYCDQLEGSCGLSVDRYGCLLIAESSSGRVLRISETGGREIIKQGLQTPKRVLDIHGNLVFVCVRGLYTDLPGRICGILSHVPGLYNGAAACAKDGSTYILDSFSKRLLCFDGNGTLLASVDCANAGLDGITALACDRDGALYAATATGEILLLKGAGVKELQADDSAIPQRLG